MNAAIRSKNTLYLASRVVLACAISCVFWGLAGCGSSSGGSSGTGSGSAAAGGTPLVSGGAKDIYVIQFDSSNESNSILDFAADTNGTLSPKGTLLPPTGFAFDSMATDSAGQLYLGGQNVEGGGNPLNQVLVYAAGATGAATPLRTITLPNDENDQYLPLDMTVDSTGKLYVVGLGLVGTFPANASGDTSPITSFSVTQPYENVSANGPTGIAVDTAGNIYLGMYLEAVNPTVRGGSIFLYAAGASGNATPQILQTQGIPYGVTVDMNGNVYSAVDNTTVNSSGAATASTCALTEFGAIGSSAAVVKTISGTATGLDFCVAPQMDAAGNLYLINAVIGGTQSSPTYAPEVVGFAPTASGDVAPGIVFTSSAWTDSGSGLAVH